MSSAFTTWKELLSAALEENHETWEDVIENTMSEQDMQTTFDAGYGGTEGCSFTMWTTNTVYFPVQYDGSESVGSVSRNPNGIPTYHIGG